jgi:hypothetical protein
VTTGNEVVGAESQFAGEQPRSVTSRTGLLDR